MSVGKVFLLFIKKHKIRVLLIVLSIILVSVLALLPAQVLKVIVDEIIPLGDEKKLLYIALVYLLTYICIGIATFLKDVIMICSSQHYTSELRSSMMKHMSKLSYQSLVNTDSGTLEAYFNNDVNSLNELFTSGVVNMITDLFKMIGIMISLFIYSYVFGLIMLGILPVLLIFTFFVRRGMLKAQLKTKAAEGNVNKILLENIENMEQIKVNKAEDYAKNKYFRILKNHFKASQKSNFYDAFFSPVMQMIRNFVICLILILSGWNPHFFGMSIGMIIASISLITDLFSPIENLGMEIQTIQKSIAALKRINEFFMWETDAEKKNFIINEFTIQYDKVSFGYGERDIIKDFSLVIHENDKIVLQGPSGVGKSTLMKLAMGLIKPNKGSVTIGGESLYLLSDSMRKKLFSIVYQDPFFSGDSIYEEISLRDESITKEQVRDALDKVGLSHIKDLDKRLNASEYSSGELALFNIARILVQDSKIIFLDEMNSKIDPITSKQMISLINDFAKDKTVISINHYGAALDGSKIIQLE